MDRSDEDDHGAGPRAEQACCFAQIAHREDIMDPMILAASLSFAILVIAWLLLPASAMTETIGHQEVVEPAIPALHTAAAKP